MFSSFCLLIIVFNKNNNILGANSQQSPLNQMHLGLQLVTCLTEHNLEYVCGDWQ